MIAELLIIALIFFFWPRLCAFLSKTFLPWAKETFGEEIGDMLETLTIWLNRGIRGVRRGIKQAWKFLKERVLRMKSVYSTSNGVDVTVETTARVKLNDGRYVDIVETSDLPMDDIPLKMQEEIIRQQKTPSGVRQTECNELDVLTEQAKKCLEADKKLAASREEEIETQELCALVTGNV